jgi:hypothetical protein
MNVNQYEEDLPLITEAIQDYLEILKDLDEDEQVEYRKELTELLERL